MKRLTKTISSSWCFALLLLLFSCGNWAEKETTTVPTEVPFDSTSHNLTMTSIRTTETLSLDDYNAGPYWTVYYDEEGYYSIAIKNKNGKTFYHDYLEPRGIIEKITETLFSIWQSGGNELSSIRYFDVKQGLISPTYWNPFAIGFGKVAYTNFMEGNGQSFVVHDMFDPEVNRVTFERSGLVWSGALWAPEADYTTFPFTKAEFLDENRLHVIYLTVDDEQNKKFVEEILELY